MKTLLRAVARLYPRAWRQRYGEEFDLLIEDLPPRWRNVIDVTLGALTMQMTRPALLPIASVTLVGAVVGAAVSLARPPLYASSSTLAVSVVPASLNDVQGAERMRFVKAALDGAALDKAKTAVTLRQQTGDDPLLIEVATTGDNAQAAQQSAALAVQSIVTANLRANESLTPERRDPTQGVQVRVLDRPSLPTAGRRPTVRDSLAGTGVGLIGGIGLAIIAHHRRRAAA